MTKGAKRTERDGGGVDPDDSGMPPGMRARVTSIYCRTVDVKADVRSTEQIVRTYWRLTEIEATFRFAEDGAGAAADLARERISPECAFANLFTGGARLTHAVHLIRTWNAGLKARDIAPRQWERDSRRQSRHGAAGNEDGGYATHASGRRTDG